MKYLLTALIFMSLLICIPNAASADTSKVWMKGETIAIVTICKDEESILKIVKADTISEEEVLARMFALTRLNHCIGLPMPLPFYVRSLFIEYKDFEQRPSVVLSVAYVTEPDEHIGFVLAEGTYKIDTGI